LKFNRVIVVGDIHGEFDNLQKVMNAIGDINEDDLLIFLGDYIDRGYESYDVLNYLKSFKNDYENNSVFLKGNHEDMMFRYFDGDIDLNTAVFNGLVTTLESYKHDIEQLELDLNYLEMKLFFEWGDYIFVHAGLKPDIALYEQSEDDLLWIRSAFLGHDFSNYGKWIVAGHTVFGFPIKNKGKILIDTGSGKGGYLSAVDIINNLVYTSEKEVIKLE